MLQVFLNSYIADLSRGRDRIHHDLNAKRWDCLDPDLNRHIVPRGMKLLVEQLFYAKDEVTHNKPCKSVFTQIYGIPCYHQVRDRERLSVAITKDDFHPHWHFERPFNGEALGLLEPPLAPPGPIIFRPNVVVTRGRKRKDKSVRRDPSAWEIANRTQTRRPGRIGGATSVAINSPHIETVTQQVAPATQQQVLPVPTQPKRGRPKGSKNKQLACKKQKVTVQAFAS